MCKGRLLWFNHSQKPGPTQLGSISCSLRKTNSITPIPPFLLLRPSLYTDHHAICSERNMSMKYLLDQMRQAVLVVSPPNCLCSPSLLTTHWLVVPGEKKPWLCKHCSAVAITSLCFQHCFQHKPKMQSHRSYCDENGHYSSQNQHRPQDNQCRIQRRWIYT